MKVKILDCEGVARSGGSGGSGGGREFRSAQTGQSKSLAGEEKLGGTEEEETMTSESGVVAGESTGGEAMRLSRSSCLREDESRARYSAIFNSHTDLLLTELKAERCPKPVKMKGKRKEGEMDG
ncbi:hypothetical protein F2Q70_00001581 [Brassica cretica]|uniref:Uncharacterized protein n=1 Tax=Brassica cretica TaxID=69181 RepID=A0A8S9IU68_BRACR|nr:hypothetical protein F2Q70_00001581 [Brassica cretica]